MKALFTAPFMKTPVQLTTTSNRGQSFFPQDKGKKQMLGLFDANGTVRAIVGKTAESVSLTDWHLYRKSSDQRRNYGPAQDTRVEILPDRHLASKVWAKPNKFFTQQEFVESFMQHLELTGEAYWVIEYTDLGHIPVAMWVVTPDRMEPVADPDEYLAGWVYSSPDGEKVPLELDQVIQIRVPNPLNSMKGSSPYTSVLPDIQAGRNAAEWNNKFYVNSARPGGVITAEEDVTDAEFDRIMFQWRERHQGMNNAHRVAVLENNMKFTPLDTNQKDQQFVEQRELTREVIREASAFPKPMLGATDDVNRANAEAAEYVYSKWYVEPRLKRIKQALNNDFLPLFGTTGSGVEFDYDCPVPEDLERQGKDLDNKTKSYTRLIRAGVDPDDAAEVVGLPPMTVKEVAYYGGSTGDEDGSESSSDEPAEETV